MCNKDTILNDKRKIKYLTYNNDNLSDWSIKDGHEIEAYPEPGPHGVLPWFRVKQNGVVIVRVPAGHVEVVYVKEVEGV